MTHTCSTRANRSWAQLAKSLTYEVRYLYISIGDSDAYKGNPNYLYSNNPLRNSDSTVVWSVVRDTVKTERIMLVFPNANALVCLIFQ